LPKITLKIKKMKYYRSKNLPALAIDMNNEVMTSLNIEYVQAETVTEAQQLGADLIDLSYADYLQIKDQFIMTSIDSYGLGSADCIIKINGEFRFYQLSQHVFLSYMEELKVSLNSVDIAVLVGDEMTISQYLPALTQLGYGQFIFVVENMERVKKFIERIQRTYFSLSIQILNFHQVGLIEIASSFLLVDIDHSQHPELVESLTYFNFLTAGSLFIDMRSALNEHLVEEAKRALMFVADTRPYQQNRFLIANQVLFKKNK
jgi:hypothetical protein